MSSAVILASCPSITSVEPQHSALQGNRTWHYPIHEGLLDACGNYFPVTVSRLIAFFTGNGVVFSPKDCRNEYHLVVEDEELPEEAYRWWNSLDALTPFDGYGNPIFNYMTHYGFYYIPPTSLGDFDRLDRTRNELPVRSSESDAYRQVKNAQADAAYWVAPRIGYLKDGVHYSVQPQLIANLNEASEAQMQQLSAQLGTEFGTLSGARYENFPDARDLAFIARAHFIMTGEILLDRFCATEQRLKFQDDEGRESDCMIVVRNDATGLTVETDSANPYKSASSPSFEDIQSVGLRKFTNNKPQQGNCVIL